MLRKAEGKLIEKEVKLTDVRGRASWLTVGCRQQELTAQQMQWKQKCDYEIMCSVTGTITVQIVHCKIPSQLYCKKCTPTHVDTYTRWRILQIQWNSLSFPRLFTALLSRFDWVKVLNTKRSFWRCSSQSISWLSTQETKSNTIKAHKQQNSLG